MTDPLHLWSAVRLARALATRELSAQTLAATLLERSAALDPQLHVWAWLDAAHVQRSAKALDAGAVRGALHGLPLGPKDNIDTAGIPTEYGSPIYAGHVPHADAACIALAREAGAYIFGKSASTELANVTPPATRNPHQSGHTPGGSSSGAVAAVAARMVPLALGTQTAGSVIRPASFCGIVGYKPSPRRMSRSGVKANSDTLDELGLFANSVADVALFDGVLSGSAAAAPALHDSAPRLGVTFTTRAASLARDMAALVDACATRLSAAGAVVHDAAPPPWFDALFEAHRTVQLFETARALAPEWLYRREHISASFAEVLDEGWRCSSEAYAQALAAARTGVAGIEAMFGGADVLITAAANGEAPKGLGSTGDPLFCRPWQLLGCPCIAVPAGHGSHGLPMGLQIVARPQDDERLLAVAQWIEAQLAR